MRRAPQEPSITDLEAEGIPPLEDQPPGIDAESASEGLAPPRDRPVGATEYGVTAAEERIPESLEERVAREVPEGYRPDDDRPGRLVAPDAGGLADDETAEIAEEAAGDTGGLAPEEAAMHIEPEPPG